MAQNRRPQPEAQHDSSSEEEEESGSSEEESEEQHALTTLMSKKPSSAPKKPEPTPSSAQPQSSSSESDSDAESESDSPPITTLRSDPNIKPIASKPMEEPPKSTKKPRSEPTFSAVKRPAVENNGGARELKRAKKKKVAVADVGVVNKVEMTPKKDGDDAKKQLFQRVWSEEDEIVILKGLIEYRAKKGGDPMADLNAFQDFIKKSLHIADVSKSQFSTKVRRLKKKYENNVKRGKNGQDRSFSNPHEQRTYDLSKKIWGEANNGVEVENGKGSGKGKKKEKGLPRVDELADGVKEGTRREVEPNAGATRALRFDCGDGGSSWEGLIMKDGLELIRGSEKLELEEKWKQLRVEEVQLYLKRLDLIREQTKLVLEAMRH